MSITFEPEKITNIPGGNDCLSFSAFSLSVITKVYRNLEQRTLNFVFSEFFFILTAGKFKGVMTCKACENLNSTYIWRLSSLLLKGILWFLLIRVAKRGLILVNNKKLLQYNKHVKIQNVFTIATSVIIKKKLTILK